MSDPELPAGAKPDAPSPPGRRQGAVAFIFVTVMLDIMAFSMVAPVLPKFLSDFVAHNAASAGLVNTLFYTVFAALQFLSAPVIGSLSDRFGRRPLILASNLGLGLSYLLMGGAANLGWLFLGRIVSGVTGASYSTATAYIADITPVDERPAAFGILGAAFGVGFMLGPGLSGVIGEYFGPRAPFFIAGALSLLNAGYGFFVLPESLPKTLRSALRWKKANPFGALVLLRRHPDLFALTGTMFLSTLAQVSLPVTVGLYALYRYHWTSFSIGWALTVVGISLATVQVLVVGRFVKRFGNRIALTTGLAFGAAGLCIIGLGPSGLFLWLALPVIAFWGLAGPAVQTMMTHHVEPYEQGLLQGANASMTGIAELVGPVLFGLTYTYFVTPPRTPAESGATFVLAGTLLLGTAAFAFFATRGETDDDDIDAPVL